MKYAIILIMSAAFASGQESPLGNRAQPYLESSQAAGDAFVNVSSASGMPNISADSRVTAFGTNLAPRTEASGPPYSTTLGGITLDVVDSNHVTRRALLLSASPTRVEYIMPPGTAAGTATIHVNAEICAFAATGVFPIEPCSITSHAQIQDVAPALFTANGDGRGVVVGAAYRSIAGSLGLIASTIQIYRCETDFANCTSLPIDLGLDTPVSVLLYATGLRGRSSDSAIKLKIGGQEIPDRTIRFQDDAELTCGPVRQMCASAGIDLILARLPLSLRGLGEVDIVITSDGRSSNIGRINLGKN
jgi:uncharacterized protein (TIGR03437 family)